MNLIQILSGFVTSFPWAKFAYSVTLVTGAVLLLGEALGIWIDHRLFVGVFRYYEGGEEKTASGQSFSALVLHQHRTLVEQFRVEEERRARSRSATLDTAAAGLIDERTWWPKNPAPVSDSKSALSDIELSVQGINFTQILTALRRWVNPPNEITGYVDNGPHGLRALVQWPNAPQRPDGGLAGNRAFPVQGANDDAAASFEVACSLVWVEGAAQQDSLFGVPRLDFCTWARAWVGYTGVRARVEALHPLGEDDRAALVAARAVVDGLIQRRTSYPEVYRLRADIIDLLPNDVRKPEDDPLAQSDRIQYAIMTNQVPASMAEAGGKRSVAIEAAVLAEARPALRVEDGKIIGRIPSGWVKVLEAAAPIIERTAASTGFLRSGGLGHAGTAFVIGPGIVMTAGHVVDALVSAPTYSAPMLEEQKIEIVFTDSVNASPAEVYKVIEVIYASPPAKPFGGNVALLRVEGLDPAKHPPLRLQREFVKDRPLLNRLVVLAAYLGNDSKLPEPLQKVLLHDIIGVKRILPGRLLRLTEAPDEIDTIMYDASTAAGASGGPVIDLLTGEVVGVHYAGQFEPTQGKLAFAFLMPDIVAQPVIRQSLGLPPLKDLE